MFNQRRKSVWQRIALWQEQRQLRDRIRRLLRPYLRNRGAFIPRPPQEHLARRCSAAFAQLGRPITSVALMGNDDALPRERFKTVGQTLAYLLRDDIQLGHQREWIRPLINQILQRRFGPLGLPSTLYSRENTYDLLYFAVAHTLVNDPTHHEQQNALWQLVAFVSMGNEPAYLLVEGDILVVRCELRSTIFKTELGFAIVPAPSRPVPIH